MSPTNPKSPKRIDSEEDKQLDQQIKSVLHGNHGQLEGKSPMESILQSQDAYHIKLDATHSHLQMRLAEIKFDKRMTVG